MVVPDTAVTALTASWHERTQILVVGDDDGILRVITAEDGAAWRSAEAEHGEPITHAFPLRHADAGTVAMSIGRYGTVRTWDVRDNALSARTEFRNLTEIVHAAPVTVRGRGLAAWLDLTGSLQIHDLLAPGGPRLTHHFPGPSGRPSRLISASGARGDDTLAVMHSTGRLLLADPSAERSIIADLNCDLVDIAWAPRSGLLVGGYGAGAPRHHQWACPGHAGQVRPNRLSAGRADARRTARVVPLWRPSPTRTHRAGPVH